MSRPLTGAGGIPHPTDSGEATWYDPAREALRLLGADPDRVRPVGSEAPRACTPHHPARRPSPDPQGVP
ncbi:hypothetical protein [Streptomyces sp. A30]|uniref:hypothetical protein n=1 Tax=Streptomyces sp. A30 TaxID=2789273 RepID=UPI00397EE7A6